MAATLVVAQHVTEITPMADCIGGLGGLLRNNFNLGRLGVIIFFLISGYLIPFSFKNKHKPIIKFAISRIFRLYPLYWFSIISGIFEE